MRCSSHYKHLKHLDMQQKSAKKVRLVHMCYLHVVSYVAFFSDVPEATMPYRAMGRHLGVATTCEIAYLGIGIIGEICCLFPAASGKTKIDADAVEEHRVQLWICPR